MLLNLIVYAELARMHQSRLKVVFDDEQTKYLDRDIDQTTQAISALFQKCTSNVKRIALIGNDGSLSNSERSIRLNVMKALGSKVHDLSVAFRERQKEFLIRIKDISKVNFIGGSTAAETGLVNNLESGLTDDQLSALEDAESSIDERERQIAKIAKSVHELAQMWQEISILVAEQGTILDRIDYNVEQAVSTIKTGVKETQEAEEWQKSGQTCLIAIVLILACILVIGIMIWKGSKEKN